MCALRESAPHTEPNTLLGKIEPLSGSSKRRSSMPSCANFLFLTKYEQISNQLREVHLCQQEKKTPLKTDAAQDHALILLPMSTVQGRVHFWGGGTDGPRVMGAPRPWEPPAAPSSAFFF